MTELFGNIVQISVLVLGFGFVVFFHELGHFLAAKWVGIRVEQFAVGFGHALLAWRKGVGVRVGTTTPEFERRVQAHIYGQRGHEEMKEDLGISSEQLAAGAAALNLGETEYRLNWLPLGGYVKMLGQDDLNPNATADDPRAYNRKSIGARMIVVSAGVIMNVILAAILFMVVFLMGFRVPPALVGGLLTNSPAQLAGLQVADRIVKFDGHDTHDFNKLQLYTALASPEEAIPIQVKRDGQMRSLSITPQRTTIASSDMLAIGIIPMFDLEGISREKLKDLKKPDGLDFDPATELLPGDRILAVNGVEVKPTDYRVFDHALQNSRGKPVVLDVRSSTGEARQVRVNVSFQAFFGMASFNLAGLEPRPMVQEVEAKSPVRGKLLPGDILIGVKVNGEPSLNPTREEFVSLVKSAGANGQKVDFIVERQGQRQEVDGAVPTFRTGPHTVGIGVQLDLADGQPIIAKAAEHSAAGAAGIRPGSRIVKINGQAMSDWFDMHSTLKDLVGQKAPVTVTVVELDNRTGQPVASSEREVKLELSEQERKTVDNIRYVHNLLLKEHIEPRKAKSPFEAAAWGVTETRDLLLQFYVTLQRLFERSVPASNLMGPVGIVYSGSMFAFKGNDWLLWFLAMISANLAVVNFLPIPIVDGGLFLFLIVEKIQGKPLSPRMQTVAQLVGLAIILSVFVFVTYHDIARFWL